MLTRHWTTLGLIAFALTTAACVTPAPVSAPILTLPEVSRVPCLLPVLPDSPTQADLETGYIARGAVVAVCDGRRDLAVQTFDAQARALAPPSRPFWRFWSR